MSFETKFRNVVGRVDKLSKEELIFIFRGLLEELNKEKNIKERPRYIKNDDNTDENWNDIKEQIERSTIMRYNWKRILGESLTKVILRIRKDGFDPEKTILLISNSNEVIDFLIKYPKEKNNLMKNIRINVHARFGENKTAEKVMEEDNESEF